MNTNSIPTAPDGRPLNCADLVNGAVPIELVHFPENPISPNYYKCPDPTTSRAEIVSDCGLVTTIMVHLKDGQHLIMCRTNEAVVMPTAYRFERKPDCTAFTCIYEFQGSFWLSITDDLKGVLDAFMEKDDAGEDYMTPLGLDLVMRSALFSDEESTLLIPKGSKGEFTTGKKVYHLRKMPKDVHVAHVRTTGGDDWWEIATPFAQLPMRSFNPTLGY